MKLTKNKILTILGAIGTIAGALGYTLSPELREAINGLVTALFV